jgi:hypothetical protein
VARQRLAGGQGELELGLDAAAVAAAGSGPLQIESSRMAALWDLTWLRLVRTFRRADAVERGLEVVGDRVGSGE